MGEPLCGATWNGHNAAQRPGTHASADTWHGCRDFLGKSPMTRSLLVHAAALAVVLLVPTVASADSYLVTSCRDPLGQPNPAVGWVASSTALGGATANSCATAGGALKADLLGATPPPSSDAAWRFAAPPGTRIVRVLATRATRNVAPIGTSPDVIYQLTADDRPLEECKPGPDSSCVANLSGPVDKQGLNAGRIEFRVLCSDGARTCSRPIGVDVSAAWVSLEDAAAPAVSNATVVDDGETSGVLRATFNATDAGGGLYRALVKVDGKVTQAVPLAPAPCSDVAPADANPYQFNVPVPCPPAVNGAAVAVDASKLTPGPHGVEIAVEDAAGNQTVVVGATEFPRPNVASGSAADRAAALPGRLKMW